jgi:hypothetical protein
MADVFVSYAREDETRVAALVQLLEARGLSVFWDRRIAPGSTWRETIGQALADARCVVVAWSRHSIGSSFVAEEADDARNRGILVPVLIDAVQPPLGFRSLQAADLSDLGQSGLPAGFESTLAAVRAALGAEAQRAPARPAIGDGPVRARGYKNFVRTALAAALIGAIGWGFWQYLARQPGSDLAGARDGGAAIESAAPTATAAGRQRATIQVIKINRREGGAMNLTVRVTSGAAPFEFDPSAFKLKRRDGSLQPGRSASSVVFMEALQPNSSKEYELSFDGPDGVALIAPGHPAIPLPPSGP